MSKAMKQSIVDQVSTTLADFDSAVVIGAGKLTVAETEELRTKLRSEGIGLLYLRNKLAKIAFDKTGFSGLESVLSGPSALAFGGEGAIAISKIIVDTAKTTSNLEILGGFIDGEVVDADGVNSLSKMPSKKDLQSMVLQSFFGPVSDFAKSMDNLFTEVRGLIEALEEKGGAQAEG